MVAIIGENMHIRRFQRYTSNDGFVQTYIHTGGRVGVILELTTANVNDDVKECAKMYACRYVP